MTGHIAFIGLGNMGGPMAANLVAAGHRVVGFDLVPAALEAASARGVEVAGTGAAAAAGADVVITMLPSGRHLLEAYEGASAAAEVPPAPGGGEPVSAPAASGLLAAAQAGTLFLDCSTISVQDARAAADLARTAGHRPVDAPVSGGVVGAEAGTLTFMVGAEDAEARAVWPLLEVMGKNLVHCGGSGAGQAAKVCNNMILGASMIAVSEAFVLGERLGLTHQALFDVAAHSSGQCWALTTNCPVPGPVPASPANRDYEPGFMGALMAKDLGLAMDAIASTGTGARIGPLAAQIYRAFAEEGGAHTDFSAIINTIREASDAPATSRSGGAAGNAGHDPAPDSSENPA
ncbi:3-hydroxyisobutyrate dehydrogenase [Kocuria coralli]|uniref:Probable 3-hydroxyisobutyrate dehydrogenase n=1 Tax=Kocuria coralli TaxID=1461025 RepID=A0A5J5KW61_9MICC|nr:NAD(P)-binding domain-containing protein [Kocuria coralli]KAA9393903.1 3-hydroxyisobutyrate dehydrogenase [Kocuria coralli]